MWSPVRIVQGLVCGSLYLWWVLLGPLGIVVWFAIIAWMSRVAHCNVMVEAYGSWAAYKNHRAQEIRQARIANRAARGQVWRYRFAYLCLVLGGSWLAGSCLALRGLTFPSSPREAAAFAIALLFFVGSCGLLGLAVVWLKGTRFLYYLAGITSLLLFL